MIAVMSDSEESTASEEFQPFDESEMSDSSDDTKLLDLDKNYDKNNCFRVNGELIKKSELTRLVQSNNPEDMKQLNALVTKMVEDDNRRAFRYLLRNGYKVGVLNDKGQTAVHLIFYDECQRVLKRHSVKPFCQKRQIFCLRPKLDFLTLSFTEHMFGGTEMKPPVPLGDLLYTMIQVWLITNPLNLNYTDCYGLTYLHVACFAGEQMLVKKCIAAGIDVNSHFYHPDIIYKNYTSLHFAVINIMLDTSDIVDILLKHGADVGSKDSLGRTPLHLACRLYRSPSDLQIWDREIKDMDSKQLAPLIIESPQSFFTKCSRFVLTFLENHSDVNARDNFGNTPLHSIFPEKYADELVSRYKADWHDYCVPIQETTVKFAFLVNSGADVTAINDNGDTILHLITKNLKAWRDSSLCTDIEFDDSCHTEMVRKVLSLDSGIDVNLANNFGQTPLQLAVESMSSDIVKLLVNHDADLSNVILKTESFHYPNVAPSYDAVRNIIFMIETFNNADLILTLETNVKILRFLLHNPDDCECLTKNWRHGVIYGSESHVRSILRRYVNFIENGDDLNDLLVHVKIIDVFSLYMNEETLDLIRRLTNLDSMDFGEGLLDKIRKELHIIKRIVSVETRMSLYAVIANHPYNIPEEMYRNFDCKQVEDFRYVGGMILGHMTKALLRSYVVKSSGDCIRVLCPFLPDICCQIIGKFLNNDSILNVCIAVDD